MGKGVPNTTAYALVSTVQEIANVLEDKLSDRTADNESIDSIFVLEELLQDNELTQAVQKFLKEKNSSVSLTKETFMLALGYLVWNRQASLVSCRHDNKSATKGSEDQQYVVGIKIGNSTVSPQDGNILLIKHAYFILQQQVLHLLDEIVKYEAYISSIV